IGRDFRVTHPVDRQLLIVSTICFLAAVMRTVIALGAGTFRLGRFNFLAIGLGFIFQTAFLSIRGHELHRCPVTNLFEVLIFLACVVGVMYLVQELQLKPHQLHSFFYHLPPLTDLFAAITRLLWVGFALYSLGLASGFFVDAPLPRVQVVCAFGVWLLYAAILQGRHLRRLAPTRVATLCIVGFAAALTLLWGISFTAQMHSLP